MRNASSSLTAPIALVIALAAFMAVALLSLGQSASIDHISANVATADSPARQG